eukprot:scaffold7381_cov310-Pinguiococcus_pyrenoidosus.AAC.104
MDSLAAAVTPQLNSAFQRSPCGSSSHARFLLFYAATLMAWAAWYALHAVRSASPIIAGRLIRIALSRFQAADESRRHRLWPHRPRPLISALQEPFRAGRGGGRPGGSRCGWRLPGLRRVALHHGCTRCDRGRGCGCGVDLLSEPVPLGPDSPLGGGWKAHLLREAAGVGPARDGGCGAALRAEECEADDGVPKAV